MGRAPAQRDPLNFSLPIAKDPRPMQETAAHGRPDIHSGGEALLATAPMPLGCNKPA